MRAVSWQNIKTGEVKLSKRSVGQLSLYAFSGIHIISPRFLNLLTEEGKFSIIQPYLRLAKTKTIQGFDHSDSYWIDVGKLDSLEEAKQYLKENPIPPAEKIDFK